jgi:hypothetical protein
MKIKSSTIQNFEPNKDKEDEKQGSTEREQKQWESINYGCRDQSHSAVHLAPQPFPL